MQPAGPQPELHFNGRSLPDRPELPELRGSHRVRFLVLGMGFTGLAVARELALAYPDEQILLVDAADPGAGASYQSSGFLVPLGHFDRPGSPHNHRLWRLGQAGMAALKQLVERYQIDCDWQPVGRIIAARGTAGESSLRRIAASLRALPAPVVSLSATELRQRTGMQGYTQAVVQADACLIDPTRLALGLLRHLPENVVACARSPIRGEGKGQLRSNHPLRLTSPRGDVVTDQLFVCTNAWAPQVQAGAGRIFPIRTFASVVQLPAELESQGTAPWGLTSPERIGSSLRTLPGKRLQVRNLAFPGFPGRHITNELQSARELHQRILERRFPTAGNWQFLETWCGTVGVTANAAQWFGQVGPRVLASAGYNGHGIAQATISGRLLVEQFQGKSSRLLHDMRSLPRPWPVPRPFWLNLGTRAVLQYLQWRFGNEI